MCLKASSQTAVNVSHGVTSAVCHIRLVLQACWMPKWRSSSIELLGKVTNTTAMAAMQGIILVPATAVASTSCSVNLMGVPLTLLARVTPPAGRGSSCPGPLSQYQSARSTARTAIMALCTSSTSGARVMTAIQSPQKQALLRKHMSPQHNQLALMPVNRIYLPHAPVDSDHLTSLSLPSCMHMPYHGSTCPHLGSR